MFSIEEINKFKVEINKLLTHSFDKEFVEMILNQFQLETCLNNDARILDSEIRKYLNNEILTSDNEVLLTAIVKGTIVFNYKSKFGEFLAQRGK
jgi:ribosomal protein L16 Arg81 hydroxylase